MYHGAVARFARPAGESKHLNASTVGLSSGLPRRREAAPVRTSTCTLKPTCPAFAIFSHRTCLLPCLASSHPQRSPGCSSSSSSMQPGAGLGWAGEGGCRSYLGRTHPIRPSSGGVAGTSHQETQARLAHSFPFARAGQISAVPARWTGWADGARREATRGGGGAARPPSLPTKDPRGATFCLPSCLPGVGR